MISLPSVLFFVKKLIESIILPPGILIVIFLFIFVLEKNKKFVRFFAFACALFVYFISIEPGRNFLLSFLEKGFCVSQTLDANAIVILGGGAYSLNYLSEDTQNRTLTGYLVYKKTHLPIIVSGGAVFGDVSDAKAMANMLKELGVKQNDIIEENKSKDTRQNALFVAQICKTKGYKTIILVTSAYHMKRALSFFKQTGLKIIPYPADFKQTKGHYNAYSFLPALGNFAASTKELREYIALMVNYISPLFKR